MLISYIRTPKKVVAKVRYTPAGMTSYLHETGGDPYGIIIATERNRVGWAVCSPKDHYDKEMGMKIALNRADYYGTDKDTVLQSVPDSIRQDVLKMYDRSERYYK